jgi:mRNA interferase RelE/StbE
MYKIELAKSPVKDLERFDKQTQEQIYKALEVLKINPFQASNVKKLKGELQGRFRYRIGDLRIIYKMTAESKTIFIEAIGRRGSIYR